MYLARVIYKGFGRSETLEKSFKTVAECKHFISECPNLLSWSIHPLFVQDSIDSSDSPGGVHLCINVFDREDPRKFDVIHDISLGNLQELVFDKINPYEVREVRVRISIR